METTPPITIVTLIIATLAIATLIGSRPFSTKHRDTTAAGAIADTDAGAINKGAIGLIIGLIVAHALLPGAALATQRG